MRVLFVTNSLEHGGAERHAITLMNGLARRGHRCHAAFIKNGRDQIDRVRLGKRGTLRGLQARRYLDRHAIATLAKLIADVRPSVIVAANEYALLYSSLARRLSRIRTRLVVTYHAARLLGAKENLKMLAYRPFFWSADCAIFVCERQKRRWLRHGVLSRRNLVIYNGVDMDEFSEKSLHGEREASRSVLGFADSDFVIGATAALRPEKNHAQLVDAVAKLRERNIAARALFIGDGEMRGKIESRARLLGVPDYVTITGFQSDVRPFVLACDTTVLCSVTEALSLAAIEAMALGRPVVHSNVGGAPEMIIPGWNGFLFPVNDTRALVEKLTLLTDRALCRRMGENARTLVSNRFSEGTMVRHYEQALLELSRAAS